MTFDAGAIEARLILNRQEFQAELAAATAEGDAFDGKTFEAKATLNTDEVKAALAAIEAEWSTLKAQLAEGTELNLDDDEALGKIAEVEAAFQALRGSLEQDVKIKTDSNAASKIAEQLASSGPVEQSLTIDPAKAFAALQEIQDKYLELKVLLESLRLDLDTTDFDDAIIRAITEVSILKRAVTDMKLTVDNTEALRAIAETATAYHTMRATLTSNMSLGGGSAVVAGAAAGAGAGGGGGGGGGAAGAAAAGAAAGGAARGVIAFTNGLAGLNTQFRLFGGVLPGFLGAIGSIHLIIEGAVEILGTLIPATIAFTTFGVAAIQTVTDLSSRMQALYQVSDAYGKSIYPLTGQQQALAASVRPEVYVLFGEALDIINSKAGAFNQLATQSGQVLDQLFARLDNAIAGTKGLSSGLQGVARATGVAITQGSGFSIFLHNAAADLSGWGNLIGNIGGIIGNVIKVLPGYAGVLLTALQALSHAIEVFTGSKLGGWIVGIGIAFHGAIIWVGLLATAFAYLARTSLVALDSVLARVAIGLLNMGGVAAKAGAGVAALSDAADAAAGLPWGWISLVAAAVGVLAYKMLTAKDAAQEFNASLQQTIQNSPILQISQTIQQAMDATSQKIVSSQKAVTVAIATAWQQTGPLAARGLDVYKQGVDAAETSNAQYKSGLQSLKQENDLVNSRVQALGKAYGSTGAALVALNEAGITSAQLTNQSGSAWAQVLIILNGYQNTIRAITQTTGRYGAAENALNFSLFDTANKLGFAQDTLQKITQAEDGLLNVIIGGEQSFIAFQQAIQQTGTAAKATGASLGGLSANSLTLASDFYTTALPAAQKLADSLQLMEISSTNFTKVIATSAGQMLQYAGTNLAARDSVAAFINNAVGPGTVSLKDLNKWVGSNQVSMSQFQNILTQATGAASQLAGVVGQDLNAEMAQAVIAANGGQKAFTDFAKGLISGVTSGKAFTTSGTDVIKQLLEQGDNAIQTKNSFEQFAKQLGASNTQANALWQTLSRQVLTEAGSKAGETWKQFQTLAGQLGYSNKEALALWQTLKDLSAGKYSAFVDVVVAVNTAANAAGVKSGTGSGNVSGGGLAAGGKITLGSGPTADDVVVRVSKDETVVSAADSKRLAPLFALMGIPGYANGGIPVPTLPGLPPSALSGNGTNVAVTPGVFVGNYTGVVSPVGGGFGLTDANLGIAPSTSSSSSGGGAGSSGGTGTSASSGTGTVAKAKAKAAKQVAETQAKKAAVEILEKLMPGYIWHNQLGIANQANALLTGYGVSKYTGTLSEIRSLDDLMVKYQKSKNNAAALAAFHLLESYGVHVSTPDFTAKGNAPKKAVIGLLSSMVQDAVVNNDMTSAGQVNSLLTGLGVSRFTGELTQIRNLDQLLAKFEKAKNAGEVKAIETLLKQYGVKKFDMGGQWDNMTLGVNTSGRSETVISGASMDDLVSKLEDLCNTARSQLKATQQVPRETGRHVSEAVQNSPLYGAGLGRRYGTNR